jgi:DNA (cytosine-5)-methyltransferase 1
MRYGSICSGVEAATLAWELLGWEPAFFAEVEPFPSAVLMQRFDATKPKRPLEPEEADTRKEYKQRESWKKQIDKFPDGGTIPNLGDFTKITEGDYDGKIDLLVGGCPCQAYSIAGLRRGLDDPRGNLSLEFARLAYRTKVRWTCYENVPGLLSQGQGNAFAEILSALCGWNVEVPVLGRKKNGSVVRGWKNSGIITPAPGGYGLAWRIIDAQYTRVDGYRRAVPQRRRRLFLIGSLGSWQRAAAVLFDEESLRGHTAPERKARAGIARSLTASSGGVSGKEQQHTFINGHGAPLNALSVTENGKEVVSFAQNTRNELRYVNGDGQITGALAANPGMKQTTYLLCIAHGQGNAEVLSEKSPTLNCNHEAPIICRESGQGFWQEDGASGTVKVNGSEPTTVICLNNRPQEFRVAEHVQYPLRATDYKQPPIICYENHPQDCRVKECADGVCPQVNAKFGTGGGNTPLVQVAGFLPGQGGKAGSIGYEDGLSPTLRSGCDSYGVISYGIAENIINRKVENGGNGTGMQEGVQYTLNTVAPHGVAYCSVVRRMMPIECERLMGFPDNHTQINWNDKPEEECPDSHRYKACGNSMTINCMRWIGWRIQMVEIFFNG